MTSPGYPDKRSHHVCAGASTRARGKTAVIQPSLGAALNAVGPKCATGNALVQVGGTDLYPPTGTATKPPTAPFQRRSPALDRRRVRGAQKFCDYLARSLSSGSRDSLEPRGVVSFDATTIRTWPLATPRCGLIYRESIVSRSSSKSPGCGSRSVGRGPPETLPCRGRGFELLQPL